MLLKVKKNNAAIFVLFLIIVKFFANYFSIKLKKPAITRAFLSQFGRFYGLPLMTIIKAIKPKQNRKPALKPI